MCDFGVERRARQRRLETMRPVPAVVAALSWLAATAAVGALGPGAAGAYAGACPSAHLAVMPADNAQSVPTNVQVRLLFERDEVEAFELIDGSSSQIAKTGMITAAKVDVVVRRAGGREVAATVTRALAAAHPVVIVQPTAALAAHAHYEVVARGGGGELIVSRFETGATALGDVPALSGVVRARALRWAESSHPSWKDPHGSYAEVTLDGVRGAAGYELHERTADEPASAHTLRAVLVQDRDDPRPEIRFGSLGACGAPDYAFPPVPRGKRHAPHHLWIRAFDLAGHVSSLREITLDLAPVERAP